MAAIAAPSPADHMDAIALGLANAMNAAIPPADAAPPVEQPLVTPPADQVVAAPVEAEPPAVHTVDLESIDFEAPLPIEDELPGIKTPASIGEAEVVKTLEQKLADPNTLPDEIEAVFLKTSRGRAMLSNYKMVRELSKPPETDAEGKEIGGIGRMPTVEEIRAADASHRAIQTMSFEMESDPASFVGNLFVVNPETGLTNLGANPQQTARLLETIPHVLIESIQSADPQTAQVYQSLMASYSAPVFNQFFNHQYAEALKMPDGTQEQKNDKLRVLDALQISEFKAFGQARPLNLTPTNGAPAGPDPEKAALQARLRGYQEREQRNAQNQRQTVVRGMEQQAQDAASKAVDAVLAQTGVRKAYDPMIADGQRAEILRDVANALPTANPSGWRAYQIQLQQATAGRIDPNVPVQTYSKLVQNALRTLPAVRDRITKLVGTAKTNSDAQHTAAASAQMRTEPNGMGSPAPQNVVSAVVTPRQPGESNVDMIARSLSSRMSR